VGIVGNNRFGIGDTLTEDRTIVFNEIPRFAPECFAFLHNPQPSNFKRFRQGLEQLLQEGVAQMFDLGGARQKTILLAAVGPLQFEVIQHRLRNEYGADSRLETAPWTIARWIRPPAGATEWAPDLLAIEAVMATDGARRPLVLLANDWAMRSFAHRNPNLELSPTPFADGAEERELDPELKTI
jgi:peptide chain release factor 3